MILLTSFVGDVLKLRFLIACIAILFPLMTKAESTGNGDEVASLNTVKKVITIENVTEYRLKNGLRILLIKDASEPVITTNMVYLVGSRHENYGEKGMAHLLEHLLFKPSTRYGVNKGTKSPTALLNSIAAQYQGYTGFDTTNYTTSFSASDEKLGQVLALEADRMCNAALDQNDLWNPQTKKGEMSVVRNEFEIRESDPSLQLRTRLQAVAFDWHNYAHSPLGTRSDIENVKIDNLREFYRQFYQPDNAILIVAGQFNEEVALNKIQTLFGDISKPTRVLTSSYTVEPAQEGARSVRIYRKSEASSIGVGYHFPPSSHDESVSLKILTQVLSNVASDRIYGALIRPGYALGSKFLQGDKYTFDADYGIYEVALQKNANLTQAENAVVKLLENIRLEPITPSEFSLARSHLQKKVAAALDSPKLLANTLTDYIAAGDWRLLFYQRDLLNTITREKVQGVAEKYLQASNRTVAIASPIGSPHRVIVPNRPNLDKVLENYTGNKLDNVENNSTSTEQDDDIQYFSLPNNVQVALLAKPQKEKSTTIKIQLNWGTEESLVGKKIFEEFIDSFYPNFSHYQKKKHKSFTSYSFSKSNSNAEGMVFSLTVGDAITHSNALLDLFGSYTKYATFSKERFAQIVKDRATELEHRSTNSSQLVFNAAQRFFDPTLKDHVKHIRTFAEMQSELKTLKADQVQSFFQQFYSLKNAQLVVLGDFDPVEMKQAITHFFEPDGKSERQSTPYSRIAKTFKPAIAADISIETPDKDDSVLLAYYPIEINDEAADYPALMVGNWIVGGAPLHSRLANRVRQTEGLSYSIESSFFAPTIDKAGLWYALAHCAPENIDAVKTALITEIKQVLRDGFTEEELKETKEIWKQQRLIDPLEGDRLASKLLEDLQNGRSAELDRDLNAKIEALTLAELNEVFRRHLDIDKIAFFRAGDFSKKARK